MSSSTRADLFRMASAKLSVDFATLRSIPHHGERGREAESILREFLNQRLPKRFAASTGFIIDPVDDVSRQCDIIVYDQFSCPMYQVNNENIIVPANNVVAAIEVKSRINKNELIDASEKIRKIKSLRKKKPPGKGPHYFQTLGIVFAYETDIEMQTLHSHYCEIINGNLNQHVDIVFVLNKGIVCLAVCPPGMRKFAPVFFEGAGPTSEGSHLAAFCYLLGEDSLDAFLRFLLAKCDIYPIYSGHPGFDWKQSIGGGVVMSKYLFPLTFERNAQKRENIMKRYYEEGQVIMHENEIIPPPEFEELGKANKR